MSVDALSGTAPAAAAPLRLATIEDDPRFRKSLSALLRSLPTVQLCQSFDAAEPALAYAQKAHAGGEALGWDIVLTDIGLPGADGIDSTRQLKALFPALKVIVLTVFEEPHTVLAAICAGADGYLLKTTPVATIADQFMGLAGHGAPLSAPIAATLMSLVRATHARRLAGRVPENLGLTSRQLEVLRALVDGLTYREIGERLDISLDTVRSYIRQIYSALQVHNVAEAVTYALRNGLA